MVISHLNSDTIVNSQDKVMSTSTDSFYYEMPDTFADIESMDSFLNGQPERYCMQLIAEFEDSTVSRDSLLSTFIRYQIAQGLSKYAEPDHELEAKVTRLQTWLFVVSLIAVCLVLGILFRMANHSENMESRMETNMIILRDLRRELLESTNQNSRLTQSVRDALSSQFAIINELSATYFEVQGTAKEKSKIYDQVMSHIHSITSSDGQLRDLERRVDEYTSGIMSRLRAEMPELKEWEVNLFLYVLLNFSPTAISLFQDTSLKITYGRKSALKRKIKISSAPSKFEFLDVLNR